MNIGFGDRLREVLGARDGETLLECAERVMEDVHASRSLVNVALGERGLDSNADRTLEQKIVMLIESDDTEYAESRAFIQKNVYTS